MRIPALVAASVLAASCVTGPAPVPPPPPVAVTLDLFVSSLAPYGEWMTLASHGRVWRPLRVAPRWRPYLYGSWAWTDEGWFWETDEPWGWATYHYGRWVLDPGLGWVWVPGLDWAPAWVAWRMGDGFVGWAPLPPGVDAWWADPYSIDVAWWCFLPDDRFAGVEASRYVVPFARVPQIFPTTRPAPPRGVAPAPPRGVATAPAPPRGGPTPQDLARHGHGPVSPVRIVPVATPAEARGRGDGQVTRAFRPAPAPARAAPAPSREGGERIERGRSER